MLIFFKKKKELTSTDMLLAEPIKEPVLSKYVGY